MEHIAQQLVHAGGFFLLFWTVHKQWLYFDLATKPGRVITFLWIAIALVACIFTLLNT